MIPSLQRILTEHVQDGYHTQVAVCTCGWSGDCKHGEVLSAWDTHVAWAAHVDEVWQHTHTITTVEELAELPNRATYLDAEGAAGQIARGREHHSALPVNRYAIDLSRVELPIAVLYIPTAPEED